MFKGKKTMPLVLAWRGCLEVFRKNQANRSMVIDEALPWILHECMVDVDKGQGRMSKRSFGKLRSSFPHLFTTDGYDRNDEVEPFVDTVSLQVKKLSWKDAMAFFDKD